MRVIPGKANTNRLLLTGGYFLLEKEFVSRRVAVTQRNENESAVFGIWSMKQKKNRSASASLREINRLLGTIRGDMSSNQSRLVTSLPPLRGSKPAPTVG